MDEQEEYPQSGFEKVLNVTAMIFVAVSFLIPVLFWTDIPGRVPSHFNFFGEVDGWGGKGMLFVVPGISLLLFGLIRLVAGSPNINYPFLITVENAERQYALGRVFVTVLSAWLIAGMTYIEWMMASVAKGAATGLGIVFGAVFLGGIFGIIAAYLVRAFLAR